MRRIELGDTVTIDPEYFASEHRGRRATVLEVREEVREPSGSTYYHYRLDLKDSRKGDWYKEYQLLTDGDVPHDIETTLRRWSQILPHQCDWEAMKTQRTDSDDWDDEGFDRCPYWRR